MRYHLTVGTFNNKQLHRLQHPVIQSLLPRLGYNANMPKAVIYGPTSSGGLGIQSLRALQGTQKIKHVLQAYRRKNSVYKILHISFKWAQAVAGTSHSIFQDTISHPC